MSTRISPRLPSLYGASAPATWLVTAAVVVSLAAGCDAMIGAILQDDSAQNYTRTAAQNVRSIVWLGVYVVELSCLLHGWRQTFRLLRSELLMTSTAVFFVISSFWSPSIIVSLWGSLQLLILMVFGLYAGYRLGIDRLIATFFYTYFCLAIGSCFFIFILPQFGVDHAYNVGAWQGLFPQKNEMGQAMLYFLATTGILLASNDHETVRNPAVLIIALLFGLLLLVGSRSSTSLIFTVCIPLLLAASAIVRRRRISGTVFMIFATLIAIGVWAIATLSSNTIFQLIGKDTTFTGRTILWHWAWQALSTHQLLGYGYQGYWAERSPWGGQTLQSLLAWGPLSVHNGWLEVALSGGIVGFGLYIAFVMDVFARSFQAVRQARSTYEVWPFILLLLMCGSNTFETVLARHQSVGLLSLALLLGALGQSSEVRRYKDGSTQSAVQLVKYVERWRLRNPSRMHIS